MSWKIRRAIGTVSLTCVAAALASPTAGAQGPSVWVALKGARQGQIRGQPSGRLTNEVKAFAFSMSQPYGPATPLVRVVLPAYVAPQLLEALVTNELLDTPTISFLKPARSAGDSVAYRIEARHGNIVDATLVVDAHHVPSIALDILLSGGVTFTTGGLPTPAGWSTGGTDVAVGPSTATTAPPPTVSGGAPNIVGSGSVQIIGKFVGQKTGVFPADPAAGRIPGIVLDSVAFSMSTPVSNGVTEGRATMRPLTIAHRASVDAASFAAAQESNDVFSKITVMVEEPDRNGVLAETLEIEGDGACAVINTSCGTGSGVPAGKPGASAGLGAQRAPVAPAPRIAVASGAAVMQLQPTVIKVTNRPNNVTFMYTP